MKSVRVIDVGVGNLGNEILWLVYEIFPALCITDFTIDGFEACQANIEQVSASLAHPKVRLHRLAITDHEGECLLYHADGPDGHSIYRTKCNVIANGAVFETVPCTRLSEWLKQNHPAFPGPEGTVNVLRFNVEGAEWPLFNDLEQSGMLAGFDFVCGACGGDITVVSEIADKYDAWIELLRRNNKLDSMFWFCWDTRNDEKSKATMQQRLEELLT